ncbi:MAG: ABC transporter permease [Calditrichaeota bacterium]|nr:MAG: ABC transporter permease [Calditrichota bacterium]MBL1207584.1 ABC transporter permease [Calditrichota bacterium]NOG47416.1 ABC transporter permease [Calditrichota bacterium]
MSFEYFIAKRYLGAKRKTGFISIITYVSIAGIMIGVTVLILVLSVMNGFEGEVRSRLIGADAHLRVRKYFTETIAQPDSLIKLIKQNKQVTGVSPAISEESMIKSKTTQRPTIVKGIDINTADDVTEISNKITYGELDFSIKIINERKLPGIVLGRHLADAILALNIGDVVSVWSMPKEGGIFAQPKIKQFYVAGLVEFGYYEYDKILSYISIEDAQDLFDMQGVSWIDVKIEDYEKANIVGKEISDELGYPYTSQTWIERHKSLFSWMEMEKVLFTLIFSMILMVAAFNIISSLVMVVMDKTREIGILKSMGATSGSIMRIFMFEGILVGLIGTVLGNVIAYSVAFLQIQFDLISLPSDVYLIDAVPVDLEFIDFIVISVVSMSLSFISSVYPAYKASKLVPVEAIRYE